MTSDSLKSITETLSKLGFSRAEASCLLAIGKAKIADTQIVSQETANTYNMTKIMLQNLEKRGLISLTDSEDQDTYKFAGAHVLQEYLDTQKKAQNTLYEIVQDELEKYLNF